MVNHDDVPMEWQDSCCMLHTKLTWMYVAAFLNFSAVSMAFKLKDASNGLFYGISTCKVYIFYCSGIPHLSSRPNLVSIWDLVFITYATSNTPSV